MDVMAAANNVAEDYKGGPPALAGDIGKNYTTFMHELSETGHAKLGLHTAVKMSRRANDLRILNAFAAAMRCLPPLPMPEMLDVEGDQAMQHVAKTAKEFADVVSVVSQRIGDGVSANDLVVFRREWGELVAAGQMLMAHLETMHRADSSGSAGPGP